MAPTGLQLLLPQHATEGWDHRSTRLQDLRRKHLGVFAYSTAQALLPSDPASGLCGSICACLCRSPTWRLSGHVPVSPVCSDKVTQHTAVRAKHLVFSSGLLAVTLGTLCCFDWHSSNRFPSRPAFQKRLKEGGRAGEKEKRRIKKKKKRYRLKCSGEDANLNKSSVRKICFLGLLRAWENSCLLPAARDPSWLLLQAMLHVWSFLSLKMNSCALPSKYSSTSAHYCASNWTHMSLAFFSWHDWWCLCTTLGSCWVLNNTSWPEQQWW